MTRLRRSLDGRLTSRPYVTREQVERCLSVRKWSSGVNLWLRQSELEDVVPAARKVQHAHH